VGSENAGITLLKGDLRGIGRARKLSRATIRNIKQNLAWAFLYNVIGIPVAAGVFYPFLGWLLSPMLASAAMSFSSVSVIANALRLRKVLLYRDQVSEKRNLCVPVIHSDAPILPNRSAQASH